MDIESLLLPHWATLKKQTFFDRLAPELQAQQLADAVEPAQPAAAREIREWTPSRRRTVLTLLDSYLRRGLTQPQRMIWTARKGERREVACFAVSLSFGTELRLVERGETLRTEWLSDECMASGRAEEWRQELLTVGWRSAPEPQVDA